MVDRIEMPQTMLSVEPARGRQTPENDFSSMLIRGAQRAVNVVAGGFRAAASVLPGGSFITAVADMATNMVDPAGSMGVGNDKWALLRAQERLQEEGLSNSLRLLALQRKMNQETQTYTAISNVMKARHEMSKRAINNIG